MNRPAPTFTVSMLVTMCAAAAELHVPRDHRTIQAAIDAASDGDTLLVAAGVYPEFISWKDKHLAVIGVDGAQKTIIDAGAAAKPVILISGVDGASARLEGFTIRHGRGSPERGMRIIGSELEVVGCIITANDSTAPGGGADQTNSTVTWIDCTFIGNSAKGWAGGLMQSGSGSALLHNCDFTGNMATVSGGSSFGAAAVIASAEFVDCSVTGNSSTPPAVGIGGAAVAVAGTASFDGTHFGSNVGGALLIGGGPASPAPAATIDTCTFTGNSGVWGGGAIQVYYGSATISDSLFEENAAVHEGGAINANGSSTLNVAVSTFRGNHAGRAGAIVAIGTSVDINGCLFEANVAEHAIGALGVNGSITGSITNCTIIGNVTGGICGGLAVLNGVTVQGTTVCDNLPDNVLGLNDQAKENNFCPAQSPADLNADGAVDGADLGTLLGSWGAAAADLTNDGTVNGTDLFFMLAAWTG